MTQEEKLTQRIRGSRQGDGLYRVYVQVVDGEIVFWTSPEYVGKLEGQEKNEILEPTT